MHICMYVNICTTVEKLFMYMCIAYRSMCVNARIRKSIMYVCIYVCIIVFICVTGFSIDGMDMHVRYISMRRHAY